MTEGSSGDCVISAKRGNLHSHVVVMGEVRVAVVFPDWTRTKGTIDPGKAFRKGLNAIPRACAVGGCFDRMSECLAIYPIEIHESPSHLFEALHHALFQLRTRSITGKVVPKELFCYPCVLDLAVECWYRE